VFPTLLFGAALAAADAHPMRDPTSRIEAHLARTEQRLRAAPPEGLGPEQAAARAELLDVLHDYHLAGAFPQLPAGTPVRPRPVAVPDGFVPGPGETPLFVDGEGRACAVGALLLHMDESALVSEVVAADNGSWLHDLDIARLGALAEGVGMTLDEWAAIQPSYDDGGGVEVPIEIVEPLPPFAGTCDPHAVMERAQRLGLAGVPDGCEACVVAKVAAAPTGPHTWSGLVALATLRTRRGARPPEPVPAALLAVPPEAWAASPKNAEMYARYLQTAGPAAREALWALVRAARAHAEAAPDPQRVGLYGRAHRMQSVLLGLGLPEPEAAREQVAYQLENCRQHLREAEAAQGRTIPSPDCQAMVVDPAALAAEAAAMGGPSR
jgi:hypothetical protein